VTRARTSRRMTLNRAAVLRYLLRQPHQPTWSYHVAQRTHVETGMVARVLIQLEHDGYATSWWAGPAGSDVDVGPRRHWFLLTGDGLLLRAEVLAFLDREDLVASDPLLLELARAHDDACPGCTRGAPCDCCRLTHR
jgi:hypothetical protein